tara:strand:+ start:102 stop:281 length:180 start_codon:yes stop_codon:yes gene_type:complete
MDTLKELKEDVRDFFLWAEKKYPDEEFEHGLSFLLFDLECTLNNINQLINKRYEDHKNQ